MLIGYARVSTDDQHLDLQRDALIRAGCERLFEDTASGAGATRSGLAALLTTLRAGDTVVLWRLDRLGRSLKDLIRLVEQLDAGSVGLRSLQENIDTASIGGRLVFHLFGALAEFERNLIRERTQAGLTAALARGRKGGRKTRLDPATTMSISLPVSIVCPKRQETTQNRAQGTGGLEVAERENYSDLANVRRVAADALSTKPGLP